LQISLPETDEDHHNYAALESLCACASVLPSVQGTEHVTLSDGRTTRTTLGSKTIGRQPLPLPESLNQVCGTDAAAAMEQARDRVALAGDAFQTALDQLLLLSKAGRRSNAQPLMKNYYGWTYSSVQQVTEAANHLEHFHVYSKYDEQGVTANNESDDLPVLEWHTDAGLFLAFLPAQDCGGGAFQAAARDGSFHILDPADDFRSKPVRFDPNSIVVMLGAGAEHWLQTDLELKATRHAVQMRPGQSRAWYGMSKFAR
jgi:hypothetical protein